MYTRRPDGRWNPSLAQSTNKAAAKKKAPLDIWPSGYKRSAAPGPGPGHVPAFKQVSTELAPGMVVIKGFLDPAQQQELVDAYRGIGMAAGGFYQPTFENSSRMHLYMMCSGVHWNLEKSAHGQAAYELQRSDYDDATPPPVPAAGLKFARAALDACRAASSDPAHVPSCEPDICIANFYTHVGRLGMHQDRDEHKETLRAGLPVISLSLGDSCDFCYGDRDKPSVFLFLPPSPPPPPPT